MLMQIRWPKFMTLDWYISLGGAAGSNSLMKFEEGRSEDEEDKIKSQV